MVKHVMKLNKRGFKMSDVIKFNAQPKNEQGTASSRRCRKEGLVPAIIYGGPSRENSLAISASEFEREYKKGNFNTRLIDIILDGKSITAIARDVQFHPVSDSPLHIDFQEVTESSVVKMKIRIQVMNEEKCPGLKSGGVVNLLREIPMLCPVHNIPAYITVDISGMRIGDRKHISEIELPKGVTPVNKEDFTVVSIGGNVEEEETSAETTEEGAAEENVDSAS